MNRFQTPIFFLLALIIIVSCAKIGTPPGGPKDEDPPVVVKSNPGNYATEYQRRNIVIKFDEYVTLKNAFTEFTISPPLEDNPIPYTRGKGIVIDLQAIDLDTLTYTMDFGQSIADNNEGNPLPDFQFVVSKMAHIDSFSVSGVVLDAFTHQPDEEGLFVYLNRNLSDTVPYTTIPSYLGRTDKEGAFQINHIASGTYSVFILKDANANLIYDMPSEVIGFSDDLVYLYADSFKIEIDSLAEIAFADTIVFDSLLAADSLYVGIDSNSFVITDNQLITESDTVKLLVNSETDSASIESVDSISAPVVSEFSTEGDSLYIQATDSTLLLSTIADSSVTDSIEFMVYGYTLKLYSFTETEPSNQYLSEYNRNNPDRIELIFNQANDTLPRLELLNPDTVSDWYLLEKNPTLDTLIYWLPDSNLIKNDSIVLAVYSLETDTLDQLVPAADTLLLRATIKEKNTSKRKERGLGLSLGKKKEEVDTVISIPRVKVSNNINTKSHDLYRPIVLMPEVPTFVYNDSLIELIRMEDTIEVVNDFTFEVDSTHLRRSVIKIDFESNTTYILKLHEGVLFDIYGRTMDSTKITFTTQDEEHYGQIELDITGINLPTIIQLLNKEEKIVKQEIILNNGNVVFDFLNPGKYRLKAIIDENNNGEWDTGILDLKQQPEKVKYFPEVLDVRSNWTIDYEWEVEEPIVPENTEEETLTEDSLEETIEGIDELNESVETPIKPDSTLQE